MVQDVNKFGKRPADDDGEGGSPKRRSGLHKFAGSSPPAPDIGAVHGRYQKFIQSAFALKGAIAFEDLLQDGSSPDVPAKEREQCAVEFHRALPEVLADTPSLDNDQQRFVVEMACNTEKVADAGKTINLACKHLDDFKETPRAMLLLNVIHAFADIQPDARTELFEHLSSAAGKGYLGTAHLDALNAGQLGKPTEISRPLSDLAQKLGPAMALRHDGKQFTPSPSSQTSKLEKLPREILQNIMLRAIEPDLRNVGPGRLEEAVRTADAIAGTNKNFRVHADELWLPAFSRDLKAALPIIASERYHTFVTATEKMFAMEYSDNFNANDPLYERAASDTVEATKKIFPVIRFLGEDEQSTTISTFCKFDRWENVAYLMVSASEHANEFRPKPRSEMFANLIQVLPHLAEDQDLLHRACDQLAKAKLAGQLNQGHHNALLIVELDESGVHEDISNRVARFRQAALDSPAAAEPERPPLISLHSAADAVITTELQDDTGTVQVLHSTEGSVVTRVAQARQSLLRKLDDRSFSR